MSFIKVTTLLVLVSGLQTGWAVTPQVSCYQAAVKLPVEVGNNHTSTDERSLSTDRAIELCKGAKDTKPVECYKEAIKQKYYNGKIRPDREDRDTVLNTNRAIDLCSGGGF